MSCRRILDIDLATFVADPTRSEWADFREHYPMCADCAAEVHAWTDLHLELLASGGQSQNPGHPPKGLLLAFEERPETLPPLEYQSIKRHLTACRSCPDELAALRKFDFSIFERAAPVATRRWWIPAVDPASWARGPVARPVFACALAVAVLLPALFLYSQLGGRVPEAPPELPRVARVAHPRRQPDAAPREVAGEGSPTSRVTVETTKAGLRPGGQRGDAPQREPEFDDADASQMVARAQPPGAVAKTADENGEHRTAEPSPAVVQAPRRLAQTDQQAAQPAGTQNKPAQSDVRVKAADELAPEEAERRVAAAPIDEQPSQGTIMPDQLEPRIATLEQPERAAEDPSGAEESEEPPRPGRLRTFLGWLSPGRKRTEPRVLALRKPSTRESATLAPQGSTEEGDTASAQGAGKSPSRVPVEHARGWLAVPLALERPVEVEAQHLESGLVLQLPLAGPLRQDMTVEVHVVEPNGDRSPRDAQASPTRANYVEVRMPASQLTAGTYRIEARVVDPGARTEPVREFTLRLR